MAGANNLFMGSGTVWVAPVGTAFPDVDETPAAAWFKIGTDGDKNYTEDGIVVRRNVETELVRSLGSTLTRKAAVTEAGFQVEFTVMDMDPAQVLAAFGGDETDITIVAAASGVAGTETIVVPTSPVPVRKAVLLRFDQAPDGVAFKTDIRLYDAIQLGAGEATMSKGDVMGWQHLWEAIEPASGDAVEFVYQTAAALA